VICESYKGLAGVMIGAYMDQIQSNYDEFNQILNMSNFKRKVHLNMTRDIARNCRKKASLFEQMIPITLKHSIQIESNDDREDSSLRRDVR
jgi:glutaredoxin-related protein